MSGDDTWSQKLYFTVAETFMLPGEFNRNLKNRLETIWREI